MRRRDDRSGFALVLALVLLILGLSVAAAIGFNLFLASRNLARQAESVQLTALLDAGMALALDELEDNSAWTGTTLRLAGGDVVVAAGLESDQFRRVELTASYRGIRRRVAARVRVQAGPGGHPRAIAWAPYAEAVSGDPLPPLPTVSGPPKTRPRPSN